MNAVNQVQEASAVYAVEQNALLKSFDLLATAPEGVARLRELILSLAVQGKLVPQGQNDEPASVLLGRIHAEKQALIKSGKLKKDKPLAEIAEEEKPFELQRGWEFVRLNQLLTKIGAGSTPLGGKEVYVPAGVKFLRSQNVWNDGLRLNEVAYIKEETHQKMAATTVVPNDLLFNITGASIGRCASVPEGFDEANVSQHVTIIRPVFKALNPFLHLVLISNHVQQTVMEVQVGVSREGLSIGKLGQFVIPLPPLSEQSRIVARVQELMQLCDALDQQGKLEAAQHARLVGTLFDSLANSESAHALAENWQRVAASFDLLLDRPEAVDALEQTLLQLAVRGLLVSQDPNDEPASELLKKIRSEKDRLIATGKLKRDKSALLDIESAPYPLPDAWEWAALGDLVSVMGSGWSPACLDTPQQTDEQWAVLKTTAVQVMEYRFNENKQLPEKLEPRPEIEVCVGDILITRAGPKNRVGICCHVEETPNRLMLSDKIVRFHLIGEYFDPRFIVLCLNAGWSSELIETAKSGMAESQVNISQSDLRGIAVPVCSKAEQSRIVARVAELRQFCANLRARLTAARTTQTRLAEALVEQAA